MIKLIQNTHAPCLRKRGERNHSKLHVQHATPHNSGLCLVGLRKVAKRAKKPDCNYTAKHQIIVALWPQLFLALCTNRILPLFKKKSNGGNVKYIEIEVSLEFCNGTYFFISVL